jgi:transposase
MAKRGHSRDKRSDCKQVCIAPVVTRQGIPLGYEVLDGNRTDVTTVEEIVGTMEERYGKANRVWVMERGMTSKDNVSVAYRGATREPDEPSGITHCSSVPCRPQTPWCGG